MTNDYQLKKLYDEVFEQLVFDQAHPKIKTQGRGVLYTVMHIILYEEQQRCTEICNYLNIKSSATLDDDKKIVEGLISNGDSNWLHSFIKDKKMELRWIVVIACTIAGVYSCYKYLQYRKKQEDEPKIAGSTKSSQAVVTPQQPVTPPRQLLTAALCLVVPANAIANLSKNVQVNVSDIEKLIDAALYFLCTKIEDANTIQQRLEITNEDIANLIGQEEIYIRIDIPRGEEMIGKKVQFSLKRNLPTNGQGVIKELACLKYLSVSGLEKFNRV